MTRWKKAFDYIQTIGEWILIALMIFAAILLIVQTPDAVARVAAGGTMGPVQEWLGVAGASFIYAMVWTMEACVLMYAKVSGNERLRKWTLFVIFLTHVFSFVLSLGVRGMGLHIIDNFLIVAGSAWLWIRAKLNYEYVEWHELETFDE